MLETPFDIELGIPLAIRTRFISDQKGAMMGKREWLACIKPPSYTHTRIMVIIVLFFFFCFITQPSPNCFLARRTTQQPP